MTIRDLIFNIITTALLLLLAFKTFPVDEGVGCLFLAAAQLDAWPLYKALFDWRSQKKVEKEEAIYTTAFRSLNYTSGVSAAKEGGIGVAFEAPKDADTMVRFTVHNGTKEEVKVTLTPNEAEHFATVLKVHAKKAWDAKW